MKDSMTMEMYSYGLYRFEGIGNRKKVGIVKSFGSAEAVYCAEKQELAASGILHTDELEGFLLYKKEFPLAREWEDLQEKAYRFVSVEDTAYPAPLREIVDPPYGFYYLGTLPEEGERMAAVVGARNCSAYGRLMAGEVAGALAGAGITVVSGLARGIDGEAHRACRKRGCRTIAVLGCGIQKVYPSEHRDLYIWMAENGCLISEFAPDAPPLPHHFPQRNRLISGLSAFTVIVEARKRSGSLITANLALEQGRDVYAVPGRMTDPLSEGTNALIADGAGIIYDLDSFMKEVCGISNNMNSIVSAGIPEDVQDLRLEQEELSVYRSLDFYATDFDELQKKTNLTFLALRKALAALTEKGLVKECFKNQYTRVK